MRSLCRDLCVCGGVFFPHPNLTIKRERNSEEPEKGSLLVSMPLALLLHVTQPLLSGTEL